MLSKILTLDFLSPYIGSVLRHFLSVLSGVMVSAGIISNTQAAGWVDANLPIFVGFVLYIWSQIGSWVNKAKS